MAFDTTTRKRLSDFVADARRVLTEEFAEQLQSLYGVSVAGDIAPLERLTHLDAEGLELAATLRQRIAYLTSSSPEARDATKAAVDRLTREQAFTVLNRLAAIRMAEKRGLIVESVGQQYQSKGFKVFESVAGSAIGETYDRYRCYLFCLFDELAIDLGALFDRRSPQALLFPREKPLLALLGLLDETDLQDLWAEDETIGWIYQYYNDPAERKKMREESAAPRNSRELAVRNQFFTPRYVVEFLTDNTLGRIWYEMTQGATAIKEQCRYLVRRPTEIFLKPGESAPEQPTQDGLSQEDLLKQPVFIPHRPLKDPRSILMLDPACGSMHFGLYAFDLFEAVYEEAWEVASGSDEAAKSGELFAPFCAFAASFPDKAAFQRDVPRMIVEHNLHGIDIDPRAAQIAALSLWLRAQRAWNAAGVKPVARPRITRSNIVCAEPMPGDKVILAEFVEQQFPEGERAAFRFLLETVFDRMMLAGEAGSLLKIEEEIRTAIAEAKKLWEKEPQQTQRMLFGGGEDKPEATQKKLDLSGITDQQFWEGAEERIYAALRDYAEQAETGGFQRRLFAEDAARGFAFIDVCRKRYDVVLMNPPFGASAVASKDYIASSYPNWRYDLYPCFISRNAEMLCRGGRVGYLAPRTGYFSQRMGDWRKQVLLSTTALLLLADLGHGVLDGALVEVASGVIEADSESKSLLCIDCLNAPAEHKGDTLLVQIEQCNSNTYPRKPQVSQCFHRELLLLPGAKLLLGAPRTLLNQFSSGGPLDPGIADVREGPHTADNERFVRLWWEIPALENARTHWPFYAKGGDYAPYAANPHLVLDWRQSGEDMAIGEHSVLPSKDFYCRPGLTYTERTASAFNIRVLPEGCIFSQAGPLVCAKKKEDTLPILGYLMSLPARSLLELLVGSGDGAASGSAARHFLAGTVSSIPVPRFPAAAWQHLGELAGVCVKQAHFLHGQTECDIQYLLPPQYCQSLACSAGASLSALLCRARAVLEASWEIQRMVCDHMGFSEADFSRCNSLVSAHPFSFSHVAVATDELLPFEALTEDDLVDEAALLIEGRAATKQAFQADRRIELACLAHKSHPDSLVRSWPPAGRERVVQVGVDTLSIAVGCAVGRWDIGFATGERPTPELPDPFAPLPVCPPGELQNAKGLPASPEDVPAAYPLKNIPWDGILVDDPSHPLDIERRVREVIEIIWNGKDDGPTAEAIELEACRILGVKSLRDYFRKPGNFFADHLKRYSKSRRQAPIYLPLSTKSGSYTLWIYYHRLNDQTLHKCLADFLDPKIKDVENELGKLSGKDSGRAADLRDFLNELKDLKDEIERVIKLPWKPNLNDGVLITASPLWKLFRLSKWQKDLKACWEELEKGGYDWSHLAYTIWPERVEKVCEKDRSIAIAHGLEHLCKVEPPKPKKPRGKKASS